jgi:hypothetical protein
MLLYVNIFEVPRLRGGVLDDTQMKSTKKVGTKAHFSP